MENEPAVTLRRRRQALLRKLPPLKAILRGSLIERYKRCGKPGCKCADGPGHGPKYYLSVSHPGEDPQLDYNTLRAADSKVHEPGPNGISSLNDRKVALKYCPLRKPLGSQ